MNLSEKVLGKEWANYLNFPDKELEKIKAFLGEERQSFRVFPSSENIFRIFRDLSPKETKVVWFGQDPYPSPEGQATGYSFECGIRRSPSWRMVSGIYQCSVESPDEGIINGNNLSKWVKQGTMMLNTALTVREGDAGSHLEVWEPFTSKVIRALSSDLSPKVFVLLGNKAKKYINKKCPPHTVLQYEHPAAAIYGGRQWNASSIFHDINKNLETKINW